MNLCRIWLAMTTSNIHAFHILNSKRWSGFSHSFAITVIVAVPGQLVGLSTLEDMLGLGLGFKLLTGGHFLALTSNKSSSSWLMQNQDFTLLGHIINPIGLVLLLDQGEIVQFVTDGRERGWPNQISHHLQKSTRHAWPDLNFSREPHRYFCSWVIQSNIEWRIFSFPLEVYTRAHLNAH